MSTPPEADKPQGKPLEERIAAAEAPDETQPQEEQPQEAPAAVPTAPEEEVSSTDLPTNEGESDDDADLDLPEEGVSERTKAQFEKLKQKLRDAKAPNRERTEYKPIFEQFREPAVPQAPAYNPGQYEGLSQEQVQDIAGQYVDRDGNLDIGRFNQAIEQANQRAIQAERTAQELNDRVTRYEEGQQLREAYEGGYTNLDPQHKDFDPAFYDIVSNTLMVEKFAKKHDVTVKQIADHVSKFYKAPTVNIEKEKDAAVEQYKAAQAKRVQGPVEKGRGQSRTALADHEDLRNRSRKGDTKAIAERIAAATGE